VHILKKKIEKGLGLPTKKASSTASTSPPDSAFQFIYSSMVGAGNNFSLVARRDTLHLSEVT
jgi:hypothetical protein